ncbi:MAG TPA: hypothetical protein ENG30_02940 [Thermofilaceae archaeon]|nr:hypothetical protein [Thermofilaceae archaeon]
MEGPLKILKDIDVKLLSLLHVKLDRERSLAICDLLLPEGLSAEELCERLKAAEGVRGIYALRVERNSPVPLLTCEFYFLGSKALIVPFILVREALKSFYSELGTAGRALVFGIGRRMGEAFRRIMGTGRLREDIERLLEGLKALGLCEEYEVSRNGHRVKIWGLLECVNAAEPGKANSELLRGLMSGIACSILSRDVAYIEERCIAKGNEYCEFKLREVGGSR